MVETIVGGILITEKIEAFLQHLAEKGKKQAYIDTLDWRWNRILDALRIEPASAQVIDNLVRGIWSGYVGRDRLVYKFLSNYADFCKANYPSFTAAFNEHVRDTFEGAAQKAMKEYK